jgi:peptidoglycan hydrolase CwlO-like protein
MDANYGFNRETAGSTDFRKNQEERLANLENAVKEIQQKLEKLEEDVAFLDNEVHKER